MAHFHVCFPHSRIRFPTQILMEIVNVLTALITYVYKYKYSLQCLSSKLHINGIVP